MKKGVLLIFILLLVSMFIIAEGDDVEISDDVMEIVEDEGEVDVIIVVKDDEEIGVLSETEVEERKDEVIEKLEDIDAELEIELEGAVAATVDEDQLEELKKDDNIVEIYEDRPIEAFLSTATAYIKGDLIRTLRYNNSNITGNGQTVCIIDSGIDYTHPSLGGCFGAGCRVVTGFDIRNDDNDPQDDNGHGTHVSGIAGSSNLTLPGIAPGIQFAALKVLNASGAGSTSDLIAGIDWCTNNATAFNISVISMSLGTNKKFTGTCDDDDSQLTAAVNNAIAQGIFVVAASGNGNSDSQMSSPACITNVTAVGNADESNNVVSSSNRNDETDIFAPGSSITSMYENGGFATLTGTSMSTPFVSGVGALLKQFHTALNGTVLTTDALVDMMNSTGDDIDDTANSGFVFKMIQLENLFDTLDEEPPVVSFVDPTTNDTNTSEFSYFINISADETLSGAVLEFDGVNETMDGGSNNFFVNKTFLSDGNHFYRAFANDSFNNSAVTPTFNLTIQNSAPSITSVVINTTLGATTSTGDLQCFVTASDGNGDDMFATLRWFNNSLEIDRTDITTSIGTSTVLLDTLITGNTSIGDNWTCMVNVGDLKENSTFVNASVIINDTNADPTLDLVVLNATDGNNRSSEDLALYATVTDDDGDEVTVGVRWFKNESEQVLFNTSIDITEGAFTLLSTIDSSNTAKNDDWTAQISLNDSSVIVMSNFTLVINDTPPSLDTLISNQSFLIDTNISLNLSTFFSDGDGDDITYSSTTPTSITATIAGDIVTLVPATNTSVNTSITFTATTGSTTRDSNEITLKVSNDADEDGFAADSLGGLDCNDNADNINPDESEVCGDSTDNNCDGSADEGCSSSSSGSSGGGGGGGGGGGSSSSLDTTSTSDSDSEDTESSPIPTAASSTGTSSNSQDSDDDTSSSPEVQEAVEQQQGILNRVGDYFRGLFGIEDATGAAITQVEGNGRGGIIALIVLVGAVIGTVVYYKKKKSSIDIKY